MQTAAVAEEHLQWHTTSAAAAAGGDVEGAAEWAAHQELAVAEALIGADGLAAAGMTACSDAAVEAAVDVVDAAVAPVGNYLGADSSSWVG